MHTDARTTSTISVAEDAADGNWINKLVQQYRAIVRQSSIMASGPLFGSQGGLQRYLHICRLHWRFFESEVSTRSISRKRDNGINTLPIIGHYTPATSENGSDRKKATKTGGIVQRGLSPKERKCPLCPSIWPMPVLIHIVNMQLSSAISRAERDMPKHSNILITAMTTEPQAIIRHNNTMVWTIVGRRRRSPRQRRSEEAFMTGFQAAPTAYTCTTASAQIQEATRDEDWQLHDQYHATHLLCLELAMELALC
ncbi:hypothetical protein E4U28_000927 [Claviceps purpurea]|nr:hypothetical protein E4U28_000927 [Claviceps purpurea]